MKLRLVLFLLLVSTAAQGVLAPCRLNPTTAVRGQLMSCIIKLPQIAGGVVTRTFGVFVPTNYMPGSSFMILKISGTTHKIAGDCPTTPAGPENSGWPPFLQTVSASAAVLVCPQGWMNTGTMNNGERWRMWGYETAPYNGTWVTNASGQIVIPDDQGFLDAIVPLIISGLQLKPLIAVTNDWGMPSIVASQFTARRPDLVGVLALYADATFANVTKGPNGEMIDNDGSLIPPPAGPVNAIFVENYLPKLFYASMVASMCGSSSRIFNADDKFAYWASAIQPTNVVAYDYTNTNNVFCSSTPNKFGGFAPTSLEAKIGTGGINGTEIQMYRLVNDFFATPPCSYNYNGVYDATVCGVNPPMVFLAPPANCSTVQPCNHYVTQPTLLQLFYSFMESHL